MTEAHQLRACLSHAAEPAPQMAASEQEGFNTVLAAGARLAPMLRLSHEILILVVSSLCGSASGIRGRHGAAIKQHDGNNSDPHNTCNDFASFYRMLA